MNVHLHRLALLPLLGALFLAPAPGLAAGKPLALKASVFNKVYQKISAQGALTPASANRLIMRQFHSIPYTTLGFRRGYVQASEPTDAAPVDYSLVNVEVLTGIYGRARQARGLAPGRRRLRVHPQSPP